MSPPPQYHQYTSTIHTCHFSSIAYWHNRVHVLHLQYHWYAHVYIQVLHLHYPENTYRHLHAYVLHLLYVRVSHDMLLFPMLCDCSHRGDQSTVRKHVAVMFVHLQYYQFILYRMAVPMEIHGQSTARNHSVALLPRLSVSNAPACTISLV